MAVYKTVKECKNNLKLDIDTLTDPYGFVSARIRIHQNHYHEMSKKHAILNIINPIQHNAHKVSQTIKPKRSILPLKTT